MGFQVSGNYSITQTQYFLIGMILRNGSCVITLLLSGTAVYQNFPLLSGISVTSGINALINPGYVMYLFVCDLSLFYVCVLDYTYTMIFIFIIWLMIKL